MTSPNSLLWLHCLSGGGEMVQALDRIKPGGIVILPGLGDLAKEAAARNIRVFGRQPGINGDEWYTAPRLAAEFGDALPYIEALCTPNEPDCENPDDVLECNDFDLRFSRDCHGMDKKACVRNWGDGRPGGTLKDIAYLLLFYQEAEAAGDYDGRHVYNEAGFSPTHDPEWQYHGGRVAWEQAAFRAIGVTPPPSIPTEIGWDRAIQVDGEWRGWRALPDGSRLFVREMNEVFRRLQGYVEGGAVFCAGTGG